MSFYCFYCRASARFLTWSSILLGTFSPETNLSAVLRWLQRVFFLSSPAILGTNSSAMFRLNHLAMIFPSGLALLCLLQTSLHLSCPAMRGPSRPAMLSLLQNSFHPSCSAMLRLLQEFLHPSCPAMLRSPQEFLYPTHWLPTRASLQNSGNDEAKGLWMCSLEDFQF